MNPTEDNIRTLQLSGFKRQSADSKRSFKASGSRCSLGCEWRSMCDLA